MDTVRGRNSHDTRESRAGSTRATRRIVTRLVLLLALIVASLALTQCQMVTDNLTGVKASVFKRKNECVRRCADARKDANKAEDKRHRDANKACSGDSQCLKEERARHDAAEDAIDAAYRTCVNGCHNQGGGDDDD